MRREREVFELECWACGSTAEIDCGGPHVCVKCGVALSIQWRPSEEAEIPTDREPANEKETAA